MNHFSSKLWILGFLLFSASTAFAAPKTYSMKVFAEAGAESRAQEFIEKLKQLEPFKQLHLQGIFVISDRATLVTTTNCQGGNQGIARLAKCQTTELNKLCRPFQLCPIFTSFPDIGAGGSPYPVSSSSFPWTTMLHEVIHTFGFADEYAYTQKEVPIYCGSFSREANQHSDKSQKIFDSEEQATQKCVASISWCKQAVLSGSIVAQPLSNGKWIIGTPVPDKCPDVTLGVYLGGKCIKSRPESDYRPYFCPTIMGYPTIGQDFCEVQERHDIIERLPNLVPDYFQRILFKKITTAVGAKSISFVTSEPQLPADFSYGIPEVDALPAGNNSQGNGCSK